jgi:hypothetical protein
VLRGLSARGEFVRRIRRRRWCGFGKVGVEVFRLCCLLRCDGACGFGGRRRSMVRYRQRPFGCWVRGLKTRGERPLARMAIVRYWIPRCWWMLVV